MNVILTRSLSGGLFVAVLVGAVLWGFAPVAAVFSVLALLSLREFYALSNRLEGVHVPQAPFLALLAVSLGVVIWLHTGSRPLEALSALRFLPLLILIGSALLAVYTHAEKGFVSAALAAFGLLYILVGFGSGLALYASGRLLLLSVLIMIWANDVFAFLVGRAFGRHPLFPSISPRKSWEGFWGGMLCTLLGGVILGHFLVGLFPWYAWLILGATVSASSVLGDLLASRLKRMVGVKDSGRFLPGHGGVLDRLDAMLLAFPATYPVVQLLAHLFT